MLCFLLGEPQLFLRACWPVHGQQGLARERVTGKPRQGPFTFCQFFGGVESFLVAASCEQKFRPSLAIKLDRKSTRLNSSHTVISYAVFCLKKKNKKQR